MAYYYNHAVIMGRLTKDPLLKDLNEDFSILKARVAVQRGHKKDDGVDYVPVVIKGTPAKTGAQLLKKGSAVLIWGKLQIRTFEQDEKTRWMTEVVADNFQILDKKADVLKFEDKTLATPVLN